VSLFKDNDDFIIQKDIDNSSWFGFSFIIKHTSTLKRENIVKALEENHIDCRPIVTGDFTKNEVLKYFDYEIFGEMKNAQYLDKQGFFVGNHQVDLTAEIHHLHNVLTSL
jgi:CDP-6-deoxy-D-xylo-4-hexulose-3-dehydrase